MVSKGQILNERYQLLSLEGEGAMADVYRARDLALDRTVAIKILRAESGAGDEFKREARAAANLPHPNIVAVYDVGEDGDVRYIVMEYAAGDTLKDLLDRRSLVSIRRALDIAIQIGDAAGYAHSRGIIHCDIKPQNILIQQDNKVKVTDFGIARAFSDQEQHGNLWGTPYYVSPELVTNQSLTPAADVYAIGVILYELLCGRRPFEGETTADIARQHVVDAPQPIEQHNPRVPKYLRQVVARTLSKDPARRFQTGSELAKALRAYRQHSTEATQPIKPISAPLAPSTPPRQQPASPVSRPLTSPRQGPDWIMLVLGALAFLSVMGLLPLWGTVISRALMPPTPEPTATLLASGSTPTPTPDLTQISTPIGPTSTPNIQVSVPELVGTVLEIARQRTKDLGLDLNEKEPQYSTTISESHIIEQSPSAGTQVPAGSTVDVVVSRGPEMVRMPETIGFPGDIQRMDLLDLGLTVVLTETNSIEPAGLVISQIPPADTEIAVSSTVTLTVSTGQQDLVQANFDNKVVLEKCELNGDIFRPGDGVQLFLTWKVTARLSAPYTLFIHVVDSEGRMLTQRDEPPLQGSRPTDTWQPGETLFDPHTLSIPSSARVGNYWIRLGLYRDNTRLPIIDPGLAEAQGDAVVVRQIVVESR